MSETVAFEGGPGAYSERAMNVFFKDKSVTGVGLHSFRDVFKAVQDGKCNYGIVPIENSETGAFRRIYDLLIEHKVHIIGECSVAEEHCLLALPGVERKDIKQVFSNSNVLEQCQTFLNKLDSDNGGLEKRVDHDSSAACQHVKSNQLKQAAVVAGAHVVDIFGMQVLASNIGDDSKLYTRYIAISLTPAKTLYDRSLKCSLAVVMQNVPQAMFKVVSCFALRHINILKIECRPAASAASLFSDKRHWEYVFYIDYEPRQEPADCNDKLLENIAEFSAHVRNFGTYAKDKPLVESQSTSLAYNQLAV